MSMRRQRSSSVETYENLQKLFTNKALCHYLAGAIDCDGSLIAQFVHRADYRFGYQIRLTVQISQSTRRKNHIQGIVDLTNLGNFRVRKGKTMCDWYISDTEMIKRFLEGILPYLKMKKQQAQTMLQILEKLPEAKTNPAKFMEVCLLVDRVSSLNDSIPTKRIHTAASVHAFLVQKGLL